MNPGAELRNELGRAVNALRSRQVRTSDAKEKKALAGILQRLNKPPATLDEADRLTIANTLNDGMNALEEAVAAVKHGPFDGYLSALEGLLDNLSGLSGAVHRLDAVLHRIDRAVEHQHIEPHRRVATHEDGQQGA